MGRNSKWIESQPDDAVERIARRALAARLERMWHYCERSVEAPAKDIEDVHQLRVFARRAAAALEIFEDWLPRRRGQWMQKQVKRVRQAAGEARDFDVLWLRWKEHAKEDVSEATALVVEQIKLHRRAAQQPVEQIFEKLSRNQFARKLARMLKRVHARGDKGTCGERFACLARKVLSDLARPYLAAAGSELADVEALHAFRIQGKGVRYAMEIFAGAFDEAFRTELYPLVETLQEQLGAINDHVTGQKHFGAWHADNLAIAERKALETAIAYEKHSLDDARREFLAWWTPERRHELRERFVPYVDLPAPINTPQHPQEKCG